MRNSLLIGVSSLVSASAFAAEAPLALSAGEHGDYSRVVVAGDAANLSVETAGRTIRLRNFGDASGIDFADINERKKAFRIENAVRIAPDVIELRMNCDCAVRTERTADGRTVIDISGASGASAPVQATGNPTQLARRDAPPTFTSNEDTLTVEQARDRMMALLQQAADDGLINLKGESPRAPDSANNAAAEKILHQPAAQESAATTAQRVAKPVNAEPAQPRAAQPVLTASANAVEPQQTAQRECLPDHPLTIDGDDFEANPLVEIEALQTRLAETTGIEKAAVATKLANGFLSIGFGEEALAILKDKENSTPALKEISQAVAEQPLDPNGVILGAKACSGAHALWQTVATTGSQSATFYKRSGRAIETLPSRLKPLIVGRLAVKMADAKAWDAAEELFTLAGGEELETLSPELKYVQTRLADRDTIDEASRTSLLEVATDESSVSDEALLALAESYAEQGAEPHDGYIEDIGALAKIGGSSRAAFFEAYSWAEAGNVEAALLLLKNEAPKSPDNAAMASKTATAIIARALSGDDSLIKISALEAYLKHDDWLDPGEGERDLILSAADVALEKGLPNLSTEMLSKTNVSADREASKRAAVSALAAGDASAAIQYAAPYATDPEFGGLIANANILKRDYHAALATAATISDNEVRGRMKSRAGWLAKNWQAARDGFRAVNPNEFNDATAIRYGLTAYITGETALPGVVDAALSSQADAIKAGLHSLFVKQGDGTALERARQISDNTSKEIRAFEEILSDG